MTTEYVIRRPPLSPDHVALIAAARRVWAGGMNYPSDSYHYRPGPPIDDHTWLRHGLIATDRLCACEDPE